MDKAEKLLETLRKNKSIQSILDRVERLEVPEWYLSAGCIAQTVWNLGHGFEPEHGIRDYDLIYYDASDVSYEGEDVFIQRGKKLFEDIRIPVEIRNEARVHLWFERHFGKQIEQYRSTEDAIGKFPTTATSIGITKNRNGTIQIYAPFGVDDIFDMIVRPNKVQTTEKMYRDKSEGWLTVWPKLTVVPWDDA